MKRENQKQIWVSKSFLSKLMAIKAKRMLQNKPSNSIADITEEIAQSKSINLLEEELLKKEMKMDKNFMKFDGEFR